MARKAQSWLEHQSVELGGARYVILRESDFAQLCAKAGTPFERGSPSGESPAFDLDQPSLAEKLVERRRAVGLSQADLARRAGVRPETLNRIERGRTTPDFATIRKLVVAIGEADQRRSS